MAGPLIGRECKLYYNTGTHAAPTLAEVVKAVDVNVEMAKTYGDVSARDSGWRKQLAALKDLTITFGYRYRQGVTDAVFDDLHDSAIANTLEELFVLDGSSATSDNAGFRAWCDLTFSESQPLEEGVLIEFTAVHAMFEDSGTIRDPSWYEVA